MAAVLNLTDTIVDTATEENQTEVNEQSSNIVQSLRQIEISILKFQQILQFIQNEHTSPRGRADAMLTNTQHTLELLHAVSSKISKIEIQCQELKYVRFELINLTDEFTKLRAQIDNMSTAQVQ